MGVGLMRNERPREKSDTTINLLAKGLRKEMQSSNVNGNDSQRDSSIDVIAEGFKREMALAKRKSISPLSDKIGKLAAFQGTKSPSNVQKRFEIDEDNKN